LGSSSSLALAIFPTYVAFLLMKDSSFIFSHRELAAI
jgi:hypothetical protein